MVIIALVSVGLLSCTGSPRGTFLNNGDGKSEGCLYAASLG